MMLYLAGTLALAQTAATDQSGGVTGPTVTAGNFTFTLSGCRAVSVTVDCDIAIENRTPDDRSFLVISRFRGGVRNMALASLGVSGMIDDAGQTYEVESLRLANQDAADNGQSHFEIYAGTHPVLALHFDNVGLRVNKINRLTLVVGEQTSQGVKPLPVVFNNLQITRQTAVTGPPASANVDKRFVVETPVWRIALHGCRAVPDGVGCTLVVTNLTDARAAVFLGWQGHVGAVPSFALEPLGRSKVVAETGAAFVVNQMFVQSPGFAAREDTSNGQTSWLTEPYADRRFDLYFANIDIAIRHLPRLDLAFANQPMRGNQSSGFPTSIAVRFMDIPVAPMTRAGAEADNIASEWVPEAKDSDPDGKKLRFCSAPAAMQAMLQLLNKAVRDQKVQGLSTVAALPTDQRSGTVDVQIVGTTASPVPGALQSADFLCNVTYQADPSANVLTDLMMNLSCVEPFHGQFRVTGWSSPQPFVMLEMLTRFTLSSAYPYRQPLPR